MPRNPANPRGANKVTPANTAAKKRHVLDAVANGRSFSDACRRAEVSPRTFDNWRQRDEQFAVEVQRAEVAGAHRLVDWMTGSIDDPAVPEREKSLRAFFLIKKTIPAYRDNHKVEHVVSGGLAGALKQLAKAGRSE